MSAGSGIAHSEHNAEDKQANIFQIWIEPRAPGGEPRWGAKPFPRDDRSGNWTVLASGFDDDTDALMIRADACVAGIALKAGETTSWPLDEGRKAYLVAATGSLMVNDEFANERDGVAIESVEEISIRALEDTEIVLVDTE